MPKIALAQLEFKIADLNQTLVQLESALQEALEQNADMIVFPELFITGYFVGDLIAQPDFQAAHQNIWQQFLEKTKYYPILIIIGDVYYSSDSNLPDVDSSSNHTRLNMAYVIHQGKVLMRYCKEKLPNHGVFDEKRYFQNDLIDMNHSHHTHNHNHSHAHAVQNIGDQFLWVEKNKIYHIHLAICEDLWHTLPENYFKPIVNPQNELQIPYIKHPLISCEDAKKILDAAFIEHQQNQKNQKNQKNQIQSNQEVNHRSHLNLSTRLIISLNASPFEMGKQKIRQQHLLTHAQQFCTDIIYVNAVGLCDEALFDGQSMVFQHHSSVNQTQIQTQPELIFQAPAFESNIYTLDWAQSALLAKQSHQHPPKNKNIKEIKEMKTLAHALIYSIKSYCDYTGFKKVVLGLSGGVDSALVAALAAQALGPENVHAIMMPSPYTATISCEDAEKLSQNLGISYQNISITPLFKQYEQEVKQLVKEGEPLQSITLENLQARIRGQILMAYSNQNQALLLATGNKSELAMGYCTLYGDMAGGFAPIKDLYKIQVYQLCEYLNQQNINNITDDCMIPARILSRAPSAELKDNQKDQDSLPPYAVLDLILKEHIEFKSSSREILNKLLVFLNQAQNLDAENASSATILFIEDVKAFASVYLNQNTKEQLLFIQKHIQKIYQNEYKRRQGVLGPKVNLCAFARDWRVPITNAFDFRF